MPLLSNPRHERFAQLIAQLHSATSAYKIVFDCKESSAKANAGRLITNDDVVARIAELQKASATEAVMTMQERRRIAAEIARDDQQRASDRLAAIVADARLAGEFKDKVEHSGQINSTVTMTEARRLELMEKWRAARAMGCIPRDAASGGQS